MRAYHKTISYDLKHGEPLVKFDVARGVTLGTRRAWVRQMGRARHWWDGGGGMRASARFCGSLCGAVETVGALRRRPSGSLVGE